MTTTESDTLHLVKLTHFLSNAALLSKRSAYVEPFDDFQMAPSLISVEESSEFALWATERVLELVRNVAKAINKEGQAGMFYSLFESHLVLIQVWLQDHPNEAKQAHISGILSLLQTVCDVCFPRLNQS